MLQFALPIGALVATEMGCTNYARNLFFIFSCSLQMLQFALPIGALVAIEMGCTNYALKILHFSFAQILKCGGPFFVLIFALLLGLEIFLIFFKSLYQSRPEIPAHFLSANPQVWGAIFRAHFCAVAESGNFQKASKKVRKEKSAHMCTDDLETFFLLFPKGLETFRWEIFMCLLCICGGLALASLGELVLKKMKIIKISVYISV
jgi:hypothetical protein